MTRAGDDAHDLGPLVRAPVLVVVLGLDVALRPLPTAEERDSLDRSCVRLLEAMTESGVQVVIASAQGRAAIDPLRARVPRAWWAAESGGWRHHDAWAPAAAAEPGLADWIRRARPGARVIAIGDYQSELFAGLGQVDAAVAMATDDVAAGPRVVVGPFAVRELLWWMVRERAAVG